VIYNLAQLLRNNFANEVVYIDGRVKLAGQQTIPVRCLLLIDTGGTEQPWMHYQILTVQLTVRDIDAPKSRKFAWDVFTFLTGRFGLLLPQITVGGVTHAQIQTAQISAIQVPYNLGPDEDGRWEYVTNYQVIKER